MMDSFPEIDDCIARWRLARDGAPFETHSSWLCFVTRGDGVRAVLKVFKPGSDEAPGERYLAAHNGRGTVRVLDADDAAILIERVMPGHRLTTPVLDGRDDEATHIVCDTISKLQSAGADPAGWPGYEEQIAELDRHIERPPLSRQIVDCARGLFRELEASQEAVTLLHGDLHHENILFDADRGWLAIDPKGVAGEIAYELAAPLRNPLERPDLFTSPSVMDRRVRIYCERLGLDRQRVLGWCFARNCVAALWSAEHRRGEAFGDAWAVATLTAYELLQS